MRRTCAPATGETVFNAFLKIGRDGQVTVAVPQAELGQGVYTALPQILADELGADWRTVAVEPAPLVAALRQHACSPRRRRTAAAAVGPAGHGPLGCAAICDAQRADADRRLDLGARLRAAAARGGGGGAGAAAAWPRRRAGASIGRTLDTRAGFVCARQRPASPSPSWPRRRRADACRTRCRCAAACRQPPGRPAAAAARRAGQDRRHRALFAGDVRLPDMVYAAVRQRRRRAQPAGRRGQGGGERRAGRAARSFENPGWVGGGRRPTGGRRRQALEAMQPALRDLPRAAVADASIDRGARRRAGRRRAATRLPSGGDRRARSRGASRGRPRTYAVGLAPDRGARAADRDRPDQRRQAGNLGADARRRASPARRRRAATGFAEDAGHDLSDACRRRLWPQARDRWRSSRRRSSRSALKPAGAARPGRGSRRSTPTASGPPARARMTRAG